MTGPAGSGIGVPVLTSDFADRALQQRLLAQTFSPQRSNSRWNVLTCASMRLVQRSPRISRMHYW